MSTITPERLKTIVGIAARSENDSARRLGRLLEGQRNAENQLRQLDGYLEEYGRRPPEASGGADPAQLRNRGAFLERLGEAIGEQQRRVEALGQEVEAQRGDWLERRAERRGLETLESRALEQRRAEETARENDIATEIARLRQRLDGGGW